MPPKKLDTAATIDEMLKDGRLMKGDDARLIVQRIPVGVAGIDYILNGGIPRHRITIITGEYATGKSYIVQMIMKSALAQGLQIAYIDTEQTYDPVWWSQVGLPLEKIYVAQPVLGEEAIDIAVALVKANIDIVAIDSLAALVPHEETEADAEKKFIGLQAKLVSRLMRMMLSTKHNSAVICTNQLRDDIGSPYPTDIMPGGRAQNFFMSVLLRTQRSDWIKVDGKNVGFKMKVICRKSKVGQPFLETELPFLFRGIIDEVSLLIDRGIESGIITQKGPYYYLNFGGLDGESIMGRNNVVARLTSDEALQTALRNSLGE